MQKNIQGDEISSDHYGNLDSRYRPCRAANHKMGNIDLT